MEDSNEGHGLAPEVEIEINRREIESLRNSRHDHAGKLAEHELAIYDQRNRLSRLEAELGPAKEEHVEFRRCITDNTGSIQMLRWQNRGLIAALVLLAEEVLHRAHF